MLVVVALCSYTGSNEFGGIGLLPYGWDMVIVASLTLASYHWGVKAGWRTPYLSQERERDTADMEGMPALAH
ncbi:amino acid:proton symporter [Pandoraea horticolens]|uniref:Amino acid:proton symporter n=1 Tax=Pandoraea horticolens TaxID=2508298 RepID=A0A5E4SB14_9BURK|nr:amino acid:proton symporter [Pandoraea horticolens]